MVSLREMIDGKWIEGEEFSTPGPKFIVKLADLLSELHTKWGMSEYMETAMYRNEWIINDMHDIVADLEPVDKFTEDAILKFHEIRVK